MQSSHSCAGADCGVLCLGASSRRRPRRFAEINCNQARVAVFFSKAALALSPMSMSITPCRRRRCLLAVLGLLAALPSAAFANDEGFSRTLDGAISASTHVVQVDHRLGPVTILGVDSDFGWRWNLHCTGGSPVNVE